MYFLSEHDYTIKRLRELGPGEKLVYFTGFLEEERLRHPNGMANTIAIVAYSLMEQGKIILTQKRVSPPINRVGNVSWDHGVGSGFSYIAIGAIPKKKYGNWSRP
jgi:hypothetical protein